MNGHSRLETIVEGSTLIGGRDDRLQRGEGT